MRTDVWVDILIFPYKIRSDYGVDAVQKEYAISAFSTEDRINVIKRGSRYAVAYWDDLIREFDSDVLVENIISIFMVNLRGYRIKAKMTYHEFDGSIWDNKFAKDTIVFDESCAKAILELSNQFAKMAPYVSDETDSEFQYSGSNTISRLYDMFKNGPIPAKVKSNLRLDNQPKEEKQVTWKNGNIPGISRTRSDNDDVHRLYESMGFFDDDYKKKRKSKKKKKNHDDVTFSSSKVIKAANSPKRAYRRHGVIVCSEKKAIKKDEQTIKSFLKEFIPGSQSWKKEFRKELGRRWMHVYVISKKQLRKFEKEYRRSQTSDVITTNVERTIDLTRRLFTPLDQWNDPNK